jgi:hypothetical protein
MIRIARESIQTEFPKNGADDGGLSFLSFLSHFAIV